MRAATFAAQTLATPPGGWYTLGMATPSCRTCRQPAAVYLVTYEQDEGGWSAGGVAVPLYYCRACAPAGADLRELAPPGSPLLARLRCWLSRVFCL